ncbi:Siroheme synthase [bacterium HR16]|nr:Siroheme synthase [bacterium HR16]
MERGKVYLVGAGPGDPELVTLKAIRCLQRADVVLYDRLVSPLLLTYAPPEAVCEYVGKEHGEDSCARQSAIIDRMIAEARLGKTVVRLKGGDPFVFGRGGEELLALAQAGISVEVVPGVSAAIAAPASAGIPVTFRGVARAFGVFTGHTEADEEVTDWQLAARVPTVVFLMPVQRLRCIAQSLVESGRHPETPVAVVQNGTLPEQRVYWGTLRDLIEGGHCFEPPATLVVGEVVRIGQYVASLPRLATATSETLTAEVSVPARGGSG